MSLWLVECGVGLVTVQSLGIVDCTGGVPLSRAIVPASNKITQNLTT